MKMKKNWKRFFTLDRHHAEGFTLVELIVVIAILAILGGVAVPAYSGYVKKANMGVDESLAAEIEHAMILAYYDGILQPGASVVVYYGDTADAALNVITDTDGDGEDFGAAAAMTAAFGESYTSLRLQWDGWKDQMGSYPTKEEIDNVQGSSFNTQNMNNMLGQVQTVVNAAAGYFENKGSVTEGSPLAGYLDNAGIDYSNGIDSTNSTAAGNALVFVVADNISKVGTEEEGSISESAFWLRWKGDSFNKIDGWDAASKEAASYARAYAAATYVDSMTGTTNYRKDLEGDFETILSKPDAVLEAIAANNPDEWAAYTAGTGSDSAMYKDAMAFLTYMDGVSTSADSLTSNTDLTNSSYFSDGTVLNYVNDYVSLNEALSAVDVKDGAFVFHFNGQTVSSLPLDY